MNLFQQYQQSFSNHDTAGGSAASATATEAPASAATAATAATATASANTSAASASAASVGVSGAPARLSLDIFCNVIDNYGDAGVCLHLARTLAQSHYDVRLFCNNMQVLQAIAMRQDEDSPFLHFESWEKPLERYLPAQIVISAFSCRLDQVTLNALRSHPSTININLEYLSAESWVESCHALPSPQDGYQSYFFFPGFTDKTGGLNIDAKFVSACWQKQQEMRAAVISPFALNTHKDRQISLFGYQNATVLLLLHSLQRSKRASKVTVFTGLALDNINELLQLDLHAGDTWKYGKVTLHVSPMIPHEEYDQILLNSDFNLVRGEDSIVRAIHTGHPFLWQIYPQDEGTHLVKLRSFLEQIKRINLAIATELQAESAASCHASCSSNSSSNASSMTPCYIPISLEHLERALDQISSLMLSYNEGQSWPENFDFDSFEQECGPVFYNFAQYLCTQESLAQRLDRFIQDKLQA